MYSHEREIKEAGARLATTHQNVSTNVILSRHEMTSVTWQRDCEPKTDKCDQYHKSDSLVCHKRCFITIALDSDEKLLQTNIKWASLSCTSTIHSTFLKHHFCNDISEQQGGSHARSPIIQSAVTNTRALKSNLAKFFSCPKRPLMLNTWLYCLEKIINIHVLYISFGSLWVWVKK